jgi:hypothetical protein
MFPRAIKMKRAGCVEQRKHHAGGPGWELRHESVDIVGKTPWVSHAGCHLAKALGRQRIKM